jgi:hypothetical protein
MEVVMTRSTTVSLWVPRIAGMAMAAFLSLFALDSFGPGKPLVQAIPEFLIHLIPALVVLAVVALAWRWPMFGAVAFAMLAVGYAFGAHGRIDWIAAISGPLAMVAALFLVSGLRRAAAVPES